jgi:hypothetical protein
MSPENQLLSKSRLGRPWLCVTAAAEDSHHLLLLGMAKFVCEVAVHAVAKTIVNDFDSSPAKRRHSLHRERSDRRDTSSAQDFYEYFGQLRAAQGHY